MEDDSKSEKGSRLDPEAAAPLSAPPYSRNMLDPLAKHPPPPPPTEQAEIPLAQASFFSKLGFFWIQPLLSLGYKRPLVADDLWAMDPSRQASHLADEFERHFERRLKVIEAWNRGLDDGTTKPNWGRKMWWKTWHATTEFGSADGKRKMGIAMVLSDTFRTEFWLAGVYKVIGDLAQVCSPLLLRELIIFVQDASYSARGVAGYTSPSVGKGVGYAVGIFLLQVIFAVCQAQTLSQSGQVGVLARGTIIAAVYRRAMVLSGKSRVTITNSKLINHISTDVSRIDFAASFFHFSWAGVVQLIEIIIILLVEIGVASLAGIGLVLVMLPIQLIVLQRMYDIRTKSMFFTDRRIKLISELLLGIRVIKFFAWESPFLAKVHEFRRRELAAIRRLLTIRAGTQALALSMPILASILTFVTFSLLGHAQNPATIWTAVSLLNLLRMPLMMLPTSLSTIADAQNALNRLIPVFTSETLEETFLISAASIPAISITSASFVWESSSPPDTSPTSKKSKAVVAVTKAEEEEERAPSALVGIEMQVPKGELWVVCGSIGSGKSSLLQAMIGEMRKTEGEVVFGGSVSYCAQTPWIQNANVRENIVFGRPYDEKRYWECVRDSCLLPDFEMLPNGDQTTIGEKGIALSGGQRQRVSICRTLYYNADICLLDDILSALDAHVGRQIMENVILGSLSSKTRILATHAIHFMSSADRIVCLEDGRISEEGTYTELMEANGPFSRLALEYGGAQEEEEEVDASKIADEVQLASESEAETLNGDKDLEKAAREKSSTGNGGTTMQAEELMTGGVSGEVYRQYFIAAKGWITVPLLAATLIIMQGAQSLAQFDLTWWQVDLWHQGSGFYMGLYAALGIASCIFTFVAGTVTVTAGTIASGSLHRNAINAVLAAPVSMFDTTPMGRILNRMSKDVDSLDNRLNDSLRMTLITFVQIFGTFIVIAIVEPYFIIAVGGAAVIYSTLWIYYKQSSREIKRLDNVLRSSLYAHFSESLAGLATIRAFSEVERFKHANEGFIDKENSAYLLTMVNQRWLGVRLDLIGSVLTFVIALIAVGERTTLSPSNIGLVLSSIMSIQQMWSTGLRMYAEVVNDLSSVERLHYYASSLATEAPAVILDQRPSAEWPSRGIVEFKDVCMSYRPELPPVLHGLSFTINAGEKIGIVGRTGAGKSTIAQCLFRIVELSSGSIVIDGVDIASIGLDDLRTKLAIIPQDALLFEGTLRTNLDPFGLYEDAVLWSALQRSGLVVVESADGADTPTREKQTRFTLETAVEDEGLNLSVGERSLVSLARALVKDSQIVLLDEATANVDFDTDATIQKTIATHFRHKTLLCIAHRINTIAGYDRVLVMDGGRVAAFDTPANLYQEGGLFQNLCIQSGITLEEIQERHKTMHAS